MATADTLNSMRKLIVVVGLMALAPACGPGAGGQVVPAHPTHPRVQPPAQITAATYPRHREVYDTLTLGQPGRDGYREAVLDHLVQRCWPPTRRIAPSQCFWRPWPSTIPGRSTASA